MQSSGNSLRLVAKSLSEVREEMVCSDSKASFIRLQYQLEKIGVCPMRRAPYYLSAILDDDRDHGQKENGQTAKL